MRHPERSRSFGEGSGRADPKPRSRRRRWDLLQFSMCFPTLRIYFCGYHLPRDLNAYALPSFRRVRLRKPFTERFAPLKMTHGGEKKPSPLKKANKINDFAVHLCPQSLHIIPANKELRTKRLFVFNKFLFEFFWRHLFYKKGGKKPNTN